MEIKFKALKFEAGEQLTAFVEKKVSRLSRFCEGLTEEVEVALEDHLKQGKLAKIQIHIPGDELIIERADTCTARIRYRMCMLTAAASHQ